MSASPIYPTPSRQPFTAICWFAVNFLASEELLPSPQQFWARDANLALTVDDLLRRSIAGRPIISGLLAAFTRKYLHYLPLSLARWLKNIQSS
jgi:hypothetical protein